MNIARLLVRSCAAALVLSSASVMAITVQSSADLSRTLAGNRFSGVGSVGKIDIVEGVAKARPSCTGSLVSANVVLTAAHCLGAGIDKFILPSAGDFNPNGINNSFTITSTMILANFYDASKPSDVAVVTLDRNVYGREIYGLYEQTDEIGKVATLVGAGLMGIMDTGVDQRSSDYKLRFGSNRIDGTWADVIQGIYRNILNTDFRPTDGDDQYVYDYDNGTQQYDAFGRYLGVNDIGVFIDGRLDEVGVVYGDSGGPDFINGLISGVHSGLGTSALFERTDGTGCGVDGNPDYAKPHGQFRCFDGSWGDFGLTSRVSFYAAPIKSYIAAAAVPEPDLWAMMIVGAGVIGSGLRRRKVSTASAIG